MHRIEPVSGTYEEPYFGEKYEGGRMAKRTKLVEARINRGLSQEALAEELGVTRVTVNHWENGLTSPYPYYRGRLCKLFGVDHPGKLDLGYEGEEAVDTPPPEGREHGPEEIREDIRVLSSSSETGAYEEKREESSSHMQEHAVTAKLETGESCSTKPKPDAVFMLIQHLQTLNPRQLSEVLHTLPAFAMMDLSRLLRFPVVVPEEFLSQCHAGIGACWQLLKRNRMAGVSSLLAAYLPMLTCLSMQSLNYREQAAALAAEAKILQVVLVTENLDFTTRELLCLEAVRFGQMSGDGRVRARTLYWRADTYISCYRQPKKAIPLFKEALSSLESTASCVRSQICIGLALAYAEVGEGGEALKNIEHAKELLPAEALRERDYGAAELDQFEGKVYLYLAEHFPDEGYAELASDAFERCIGRQAVSEDCRGKAALGKAQAACALGDFDGYSESLEGGARITLCNWSKKRQQDVQEVLGKAPEVWRKEQKYQDLIKLLREART